MPSRLVLSLIAAAIWAVLLNAVSNHLDLLWGVVLIDVLSLIVMFLALTDDRFAKQVFGRFGGKHPMILVALSAVVGAAIFGGGAAILNSRYQERRATPSTPASVEPPASGSVMLPAPTPAAEAPKSRPSEDSVKKTNGSERSQVSVHQESSGANSPNVVTLGPNSPVTINPKVDPLKSVVTYDFNGYKRVTRPGYGDIQDGESASFLKLKELYAAQNWVALAAFCEIVIQRTPQWYTPYYFAGLSYALLGERAKAIEKLEHVNQNVGDLPEYRDTRDHLSRLRASER